MEKPLSLNPPLYNFNPSNPMNPLFAELITEGSRRQVVIALLIYEQDFIELCPMFFKQYKKEIGQKVVLYDREENHFTCILQSVNDTGFLSHGTNNIKKHYNLKDGGWLVLFYSGSDKFFMRVEDRNMREATSSSSKQVYDCDLQVFDNFIHIDDSETEDETEQVVFKELLTLSEYQATTNRMNIPAAMVEKALHKRVIDITLEDESNRIYDCNISFSKRRPNEAYITNGWKRFCKDNNLRKGSKVELSVNTDDQTKFYAKTKDIR